MQDGQRARLLSLIPHLLLINREIDVINVKFIILGINVLVDNYFFFKIRKKYVGVGGPQIISRLKIHSKNIHFQIKI